MTRDEILALGFNEKEVEAFGGTVKVRDLTIKEAGIVAEATDEFKQMLLTVSFALVEPKMSVEDLETMTARAAEDFAKIIKAVAS